MIYNMTEIDDGRIRIIIVQEEKELGTLYFELSLIHI